MQRFHELPLPQKVVIGECWARDGLQSEPVFVPTEQKVEMITRMVEAGFTEIEATSFAHPKYLPQFADAEEVLRRIPRRPGVRYRAICTTLKAVERAVKSKQEGFGVDEIAMVISSSEAHNRANVQMTREENKRLLEQMTRLALDTGHVVFGWALTAFGCPVSGDVPPAEAIGLGHFWRDVGAELIGFGDTVGVANPRQVSSFYEEVLAAGLPRDRIVVHFHDTRGWGVANTYYTTDGSAPTPSSSVYTGPITVHGPTTLNFFSTDLAGNAEQVNTQQLNALGWEDEAIFYAISACALFNFYNRWVSATGVHPVSDQAFQRLAANMANNGYVHA